MEDRVEQREQKQSLRREMLRALGAMAAEERARQAAQVSECLKSLPEWLEAKNVLGYAPLPAEFPLMPLLEAAHAKGKRVFLPRVQGDALQFLLWEGLDPELLEAEDFGVRVPRSSTAWGGAESEGSLLIVPGLAFSREGGRLGRGGGFYDRFLAAHGGLYSVAPCFRLQLRDWLPLGRQDMAVQRVIFPT